VKLDLTEKLGNKKRASGKPNEAEKEKRIFLKLTGRKTVFQPWERGYFPSKN